MSHDRLDPTAEMKAAIRPPVCRSQGLATNQTECSETVFVAAQKDADVQVRSCLIYLIRVYRSLELFAVIQQVGRLFELLGQLDLHESTLILWSTDNGPEDQAVYVNAQGSSGPFRGGPVFCLPFCFQR